MGIKRTKTQLENSSATVWAHGQDQCYADVCSLHKRTNHAMRKFPQNWRGDRKIMERICDHGVGHPDPDDLAVLVGIDPGLHGCDGCCKPQKRKRRNDLTSRAKRAK